MWLTKKYGKESTGIMMLNTASSQMYSNIITILGGLITARLVVPEVYGCYNSYGLIISYLPILQIGISNALNRNLPYYIGKGDKGRAYAEVANSHAWELLLSCVCSMILIMLCLYNITKGDYDSAWGFGTFAVTAFYSIYGTYYLGILYRTNRDFNKLARITITVTTTSFLAIILVYWWGYEGLCLRQVLTCVLNLYLLWLWKPLDIKPKFNKDIFKSMLKIGIPIFIVGIVYSYWGTINNTIVLKLGGTEQFGLYALATMVFSVLGIFSNSITQVLYPKMCQAYGGGASISEVCKLPVKYVLVILVCLIPTIAIIWILLPFVVEFLLPNYLEGVKAAQWMTLLLLPSLFGVFNNAFNIFKHQMDYLKSIILGILIYLITIIILYQYYGYDLAIFPIAMFVGKCAQLISTTYYLRKYIKHGIA